MEKCNVDHQILDIIKKLGIESGIKKLWMELDLSIPNVSRLFMQFIVDFLGRDYVVEDNDVKNINGMLVSKIFNSKINESFPIDLNCKDVIELFLEYAYEFNICVPIIEKYQSLLNTFIAHDGIPDDDTLLGKCFLLLSFLLEPLNAFQKKEMLDPLGDVSEEQNELKEFIPKVLTNITDLMLGGAFFKNHASSITQDFVKAVEENPVKFIIKMDALSKYIQLLEIDNQATLTQTVKSLTRLCTYTCIKPQMIKFFYDSKFKLKDENGTENSITVKEMLVQLAIHKDQAVFSMEILNLFIAIAELIKTRRFISKNERFEIYKRKIVMNHEGTKEKLFKMMYFYDGCFIKCLVEVFNEMEASNKFVENIVINCENTPGITLMKIGNMIIENIGDDKFYLRACQVFKYVYLFLQVPDEFLFIQKIHLMLGKCAENEIIYGSFIDFLINVSPNLLITALNRFEKMRSELVASLFNSLRKFSYPDVVKKILDLVNIIKHYNPNLVTHQIKLILSNLYEEFIEIDAAQIADLKCDKTYKNSLMKMTLFYETELQTFVDYFEYDAIFVVNRKHILKGGDLFLNFARFYTTILKFSFIYVLRKIQSDQQPIFPLTLEQIVVLVTELRKKLIEFALKTENLESTYDAVMLLTSIFELYSMFIVRPSLIENSTRILHISQPQMEAAHFRKLVNLLDSKICTTDDEIGNFSSEFLKFNNTNFSNQLIESFTSFVKSYSHVTISQSFKVVAHYGETEFYRAVHTLLKFVQHKAEFYEIIGYSIMNFIIKRKSEANFQLFATSLDEFFELENKSKFKFSIVKFVIMNLPPFLKKIHSHDNRMKILRFLNIFMIKFTRHEAEEIRGLMVKVKKEVMLKQHENAAVEKFIKDMRC